MPIAFFMDRWKIEVILIIQVIQGGEQMTKQQQEAYEKLLKALELQEQGVSRQEIYKKVGYASLDSLTKAFRKQGYKYNDTEQKYIQLSNTDSNTTRTEIVKVHKHEIIELVNYNWCNY